MSIIAEALKKAEKERKIKMGMRHSLGKPFNYGKKIASIKESDNINISQLQMSSFKGNKAGSLHQHNVKSRSLLVFGALLSAAILFLAIANIFLLPPPVAEVTAIVKDSGAADVPLEAEAYTDLGPEMALIEERVKVADKASRVFKGVPPQDEFLSNFSLSGIVYDIDDSWAIINNEVVRVGDTLNGARVILIEPKEVVLLLREKKISLPVR
jgi:hypothetical protein